MYLKEMVAPHVNPNTDPVDGLTAAVEASENLTERAFLKHLAASYDWTSYADIQRRHLNERARWRSRLDVAVYARKAFRMAHKVGILDAEPMRILDIGCGPSHFSLLCNFLGHTAVGLDVPGDALFDDLNAFFGTPRLLHRIGPFERLPSTSEPFDVVCALSANFNQKEDGTLFDLDEWSFFLHDVAANQCTETGQLQIVLNKSRTFSGLTCAVPEFVTFIEHLGGTVERQHIVFSNLSALRGLN